MIDPDTGLVIGERTIMTVAALGATKSLVIQQLVTTL